MEKRCKDCLPGSKRPVLYPGPRCFTHHREKSRNDREKAHDRRIQNVYGLNPGEYDKIYSAQGGKCFICRRATGKTRKLSVDHSHETGRVRGLLCRPCNNMLGHLRDDPEAFSRAASYLKRPPANEILLSL